MIHLDLFEHIFGEMKAPPPILDNLKIKEGKKKRGRKREHDN